jgi:2,3-bisphosphoglycerate-independent phosphoglycerate mutase
MSNNKVLLLILDGFGIASPGKGNPVSLAGTPNIEKLMMENPHSTLDCSGLAVGLPEGQMGNSEVGHLNLGAGKIVYQKLTIINESVRTGQIKQNKTLLEAIQAGKNSSLHLGGLCSDGGVHSDLGHLYAIVEMAKEHGIKNVYIHAFLDGRDTPPKSAIGYIKQIETKLAEIDVGKIATVSGRYYSMDRDKRWERVKPAYDMLVIGDGIKANSAVEAVELAYQRDETDEFVKCSIIMEIDKPIATISDGDSFIHFNFRPDRARELTMTLTDPLFAEFDRTKFPKITYTCFAMYDEGFTLPIIFTEESLNQDVSMTLGKVVSEAGLRQIRIAETEKYAHVTYFMNGGREELYKGEDRILVPSPKVPTYDMQPEMSLPEVTKLLIQDLVKENHELVVCNFANCDMVGHTGSIEASMKAVNAVDGATAEVVQIANDHGYDVVICADHGNIEEKFDKDGNIQTAHSTNPVPIIFVPRKGRNPWQFKQSGILCDVTGLIIYLLGIPLPKEMKKSVFLPEL